MVPAYELHGNFAMLECQYELNNSDNRHSKSSKYHFPYDSNEQSDEGETLYSVKWYKDNEEFYRYVPKANPTQHSYKVDGIKVDVSILLTSIKVLFRHIIIFGMRRRRTYMYHRIYIHIPATPRFHIYIYLSDKKKLCYTL